jgi:tRNA pseudouridine38-40 synthase
MPDVRIRLDIEYDGAPFHGWAVQPGLPTIEGALRSAFDKVFPRWDGLAVAGRTDAGVHARGQVASLDVEGGPPPERMAGALNAELPNEIVVRRADEAAHDFHARFSAQARSYRYRIWRRATPSPFELGFSWWYPRPLDEERLAEAADLLLGQHDFRAFTPTETEHRVFAEEVSKAAWFRRGDALELEITADSFLRHMVRTLVGTMIQQTPEQLERLLDGAPREQAGSTAPPWGLYLDEVEY